MSDLFAIAPVSPVKRAIRELRAMYEPRHRAAEGRYLAQLLAGYESVAAALESAERRAGYGHPEFLVWTEGDGTGLTVMVHMWWAFEPRFTVAVKPPVDLYRMDGWAEYVVASVCHHVEWKTGRRVAPSTLERVQARLVEVAPWV